MQSEIRLWLGSNNSQMQLSNHQTIHLFFALIFIYQLFTTQPELNFINDKNFTSAWLLFKALHFSSIFKVSLLSMNEETIL